jgi:hypothetical protein
MPQIPNFPVNQRIVGGGGGSTGPTGYTGYTGPSGGATGPTGYTGYTGYTGPTGGGWGSTISGSSGSGLTYDIGGSGTAIPIEMTTTDTDRVAFKMSSGFTSSVAPTGVSTYISIDIGGTIYKFLAQSSP